MLPNDLLTWLSALSVRVTGIQSIRIFNQLEQSEDLMAKGRNTQKSEKKKSEKTLKEKRQEKKEKKSKKSMI